MAEKAASLASAEEQLLQERATCLQAEDQLLQEQAALVEAWAALERERLARGRGAGSASEIAHCTRGGAGNP
jgi:multidrug resistance efflux pump